MANINMKKLEHSRLNISRFTNHDVAALKLASCTVGVMFAKDEIKGLKCYDAEAMTSYTVTRDLAG